MKASETLFLSHTSNLVEFCRALWRGVQDHWTLCRHIAISQWDVEND